MNPFLKNRATDSKAPIIAALWSDLRGFTLLELVLATTISSLVIGILAVSLSFCLRVWERQQSQVPLSTPRIIDLLKWQLTQINGAKINVGTESVVLIAGDKHSLTLATDHSVTALSRGVPVIARYVFSPKERKLYYAELPLDPYHATVFQELQQLTPGNAKKLPRFFPNDLHEFALAYSGGEKDAFMDSWEGDSPPKAVRLSWNEQNNPVAFSYIVYPDSLFPVKYEAALRGGLPSQGARSRSLPEESTGD
jgi:prepilin-type N-terminal cleavage/methylation domain-containing protein